MSMAETILYNALKKANLVSQKSVKASNAKATVEPTEKATLRKRTRM